MDRSNHYEAAFEAYLRLAPPKARRAEQAREKLNDLR